MVLSCSLCQITTSWWLNSVERCALSYRTRLMAADPFLFPMYYLLFKTVSDKWGHCHPMRTEIAINFFFFFFLFFFLNFYDGHRDFFTEHYFYTILSLLPKHTSHSHPQSLHRRARIRGSQRFLCVLHSVAVQLGASPLLCCYLVLLFVSPYC